MKKYCDYCKKEVNEKFVSAYSDIVDKEISIYHNVCWSEMIELIKKN